MDAKRFTVVAALSLLALQAQNACDQENAGTGADPGRQDTDTAEWFFRATYGYPVSLAFEPVVLYDDGTYVEVADDPVEEMDQAADRRERPEAWGTWTMDGDTYRLTDHRGETVDYQLGSESWYPAYPYLAEVPLATGYVNSTGGDYGNGTHALFQTRIDFPQEGFFYHSADNGIITPGSAAWNTTEDAGAYTVAGHTMVLTYHTGEEVRLSFALGAEGDPARPTSDIIFVGGDVFVADDLAP